MRVTPVAAERLEVLGADDTTLNFTPALAVRGIVYHLLDEKLAKKVAEETVAKTLDRLTAVAVKPSIIRSTWQGMTNPQRLDWLLAETKTLTLVSAEDVVSLQPRRSR